MKRICYMLIGVPGCGKSTVAEGLMNDMPSLKIASSDLIIDEYAKKKGKTYSEVHRDYVEEAQKIMTRQVQDMMKKGESFIWDQTNVFASARKKKMTTLTQNKYSVIAITIELTPEELEKRLKTRVDNGGKFISPKIVADMLVNYSRPSYSEGYQEVYVIQNDGHAHLLEKELSLENKPKV